MQKFDITSENSRTTLFLIFRKMQSFLYFQQQQKSDLVKVTMKNWLPCVHCGKFECTSQFIFGLYSIWFNCVLARSFVEPEIKLCSLPVFLTLSISVSLSLSHTVFFRSLSLCAICVQYYIRRKKQLRLWIQRSVFLRTLYMCFV